MASGFVRLGDRLLFSLVKPSSEDEGLLFATDGTEGGTRVVSSTLCPSPCLEITPVAILGEAVILKVRSGSFTKVRFWRMDATSAGTFPLTGFFWATSNIFSEGLSTDSEIFYFVGCRPREGCEVWRSDGTRGGTTLLKDINPGTTESSPYGLTIWKGKAYFIAYNGERSGLWSSAGTADTTHFVAEIFEPRDQLVTLVATPSQLFFTSEEDLWVTDGTSAGTRLLHDFERTFCLPHSVCPPPSVNSMIPVEDDVYLTVPAGSSSSEIWRSDGTEAGTVRLRELPAAMRLVAQVEEGWLLAAGFEFWICLTGLHPGGSAGGLSGGMPALRASPRSADAPSSCRIAALHRQRCRSWE